MSSNFPWSLIIILTVMSVWKLQILVISFNTSNLPPPSSPKRKGKLFHNVFQDEFLGCLSEKASRDKMTLGFCSSHWGDTIHELMCGEWAQHSINKGSAWWTNWHIVSQQGFRKMPSQTVPLEDLRCNQKLHLHLRNSHRLCTWGSNI